jgi:hypothetical protein
MALYFWLVYLGLMAWLIVGVWRLRKRRMTVGPAMAASMTELLDDRRRAAIEIVLEERAAERDEEHVDDAPNSPPQPFSKA